MNTFIVAWVNADKETSDWVHCCTSQHAQRVYDEKVSEGCWTVSVAQVTRSTDYEVTQ